MATENITPDKITVGNIKKAKAVAVGQDASASYIEGFSPEDMARFLAEHERLQQTKAPLADNAALLQTYHKDRITQLCAPRYQLDSRFVQLTLLIDQGADAQGMRFTPDRQRQKYSSLLTLLGDIDDSEVTGGSAIVLLGKPGSGKTTLLRRLQMEHAMGQLKEPTDQIAFFVPLNRYRNPRSGAPLPDPYDWLAEEWRLYQPPLPGFKTLYEAGKILLLLDGLNEMPHRGKTDYDDRITLWRTFWQRTCHYGSRIAFSCRTLDYSQLLSSNNDDSPVRQVDVEPLTAAQIKQFLHLYLGEKGDSVWQTLQDDPQQLALFSAPFFLRLLVDEISVTDRIPKGQAALLTGFVRRALYREMAKPEQQLFTPSTLLSDEDCQQVLHYDWEDDPFFLPDEGDLMPSLAQLAYRMQDGREVEEAGLVRAKAREVKSWLAHEAAAEMIEAGYQLNVLDKEKREITFFHQLIQEYFAARVLAQAPEPERLTVAWRVGEVVESLADRITRLDISDPLPPLPTTGWEETTLLAAAMCANQETFVADLIGPNLPLAARCAALVEAAVSARLVQQLQAALIARMSDPQADLRARIAAAEALGELGDPRFERCMGAHGDYLLPPLAQIPAGDYPIGDDNSGNNDEKPAHTVSLAAFELGIFPVTNGEYRLFMEAGGYEEEQWWQTEAARAWLLGEGSSEGQKAGWRDTIEMLQNRTEEALRNASNFTPEQIKTYLWFKHATPKEVENRLDEWYPSRTAFRQPQYWNDTRFNHPSQPVVGVTWFEARAYCAWLSAQTGDVYSLPTEVEWEAAARGKKGRVYPWGKEYDAANCNTFETHIRATMPVGVFPTGNTPETVADLSGNVWEWTTTIWGGNIQAPEFSYPYIFADGRENESGTNILHVLRGGSWNRNQSFARAAYRNQFRSNGRSGSISFRVVVRRFSSQ